MPRVTKAALPVPVICPAPSRAAREFAAARQRRHVDVVEFAILNFHAIDNDLIRNHFQSNESHRHQLPAVPEAACTSEKDGGQLVMTPGFPGDRGRSAKRLSSELPCDATTVQPQPTSAQRSRFLLLEAARR